LLPFALALIGAAALAALPGCGGGGEGTAATTTTGGGGAGASGGAGNGGHGGAGTDGTHVVISELALEPSGGEFIEIWNPTDAEIDLTDYYLSDNAIYFNLAAGLPWMPAGSPGIDFLARFPQGTMLGAGAVLVLAAHPDFEITYGRCADYSLTESPVPCGGQTVTPMVAPQNGGLGSQPGLLTNDGEMLILFTWSGTVGEPVKDVDYVTWGQDLGASEVVDKSGEMGYAPDTPPAQQRPAAVPAADQSLERCAIDAGERLTGGNGIDGHDETSEQMDQSFVIATTPSPGVVNACLSGM
jgi:hypothetical protein